MPKLFISHTTPLNANPFQDGHYFLTWGLPTQDATLNQVQWNKEQTSLQFKNLGQIDKKSLKDTSALLVHHPIIKATQLFLDDGLTINQKKNRFEQNKYSKIQQTTLSQILEKHLQTPTEKPVEGAGSRVILDKLCSLCRVPSPTRRYDFKLIEAEQIPSPSTTAFSMWSPVQRVSSMTTTETFSESATPSPKDDSALADPHLYLHRVNSQLPDIHAYGLGHLVLLKIESVVTRAKLFSVEENMDTRQLEWVEISLADFDEELKMLAYADTLYSSEQEETFKVLLTDKHLDDLFSNITLSIPYEATEFTSKTYAAQERAGLFELSFSLAHH